MLIKLARPLAAIAILSSMGLALPISADLAVKTGSKNIGEYFETVKTDNGKEKRKIVVEYDWDSGATYTYTFDMSGNKLDTTMTYGAPTPDENEVNQAIAIVQSHPEVKSIKSQQAGIAIEGGFPYRAKSGPCAAPARCLQIFLFDAENVVRHMMVDMRSRQVAISDYIPPQNLEAAQ